jgi:5-(carboxyamino)imidazole ribonucleotide synthase
MTSFPIGENIHRNGILDFTLAPARISPALAREAREIGEALAEGLDLVGLFAVELFIDGDDRLYVNEYAPRPHNSGHYTWEACAPSQFEMQLRAVCDLPLPEPRLLSPACMANLLGSHIGTGEKIPGSERIFETPGIGLHLYGKRAARPGRKMGHLTVVADTVDEAFHSASRARGLLVSAHEAAQPASGSGRDS